ncbi:MAG: septum formation inhibitor Maf [Syntrophomonadaceae bacterium]|nr:septum formation inhibitor Maf [Syntrophomonadaceae bacterium]
MAKIILASKSPRRRELLDILGINYTQIAAATNEVIYPNETPYQAVKRLAVEKAESVAKQVDNSLIIAADTVVVLDGKILGKPTSKEEAYQFIKDLSGKVHQVMTAVCVKNTVTGFCDARVETTLVYFRDLEEEEINAYISTNEPYDKAGGYAIQGKGSLLVKRIEGCYFNVVGLPLTTLYEMLKAQGVDFLRGD